MSCHNKAYLSYNLGYIGHRIPLKILFVPT
nr:MAG TPA: hypothetical protein [Caudoviricetes sp.]